MGAKETDLFDDDTSLVDETDEEGEGEDEIIDSEVALKDRRLHTNPFDFAVRSIADQIKDKSIVLQDEFQRRRVWDDTKGSRLIESLILNVPIPVCYFAEVEEGAYAVVDGQQRLTAIYRYLTNLYPLRGLRIRPDLNRKRFSELPTVDQRLIKSRTIRCIVILKESHPDIRFDVFERLNTATVRLNRQELRNSTYRGDLNSLIVKLCEDGKFLHIRNAKTPDKRMRDAELILRFFAFRFGANSYKNSFTRHLDNYLASGRKMASEDLANHEAEFHETLSKAQSVFGANAFRRATENGFDNQINSSIYDVIMQTFSVVPHQQLTDNREHILAAFASVCQHDAAFLDAISRATRDKTRLNTRMHRWIVALRGAGIDCPEISYGA